MKLLEKIKRIMLPCGVRIDEAMTCHKASSAELRKAIREHGDVAFRRVYARNNFSHVEDLRHVRNPR